MYSVRGYAFQGGIIKQNCSELFWATRLRDQDLQLTCISHPHWPILPPFPPFLCFNSAQPPVYRQGPPLTTEIPFVTLEEPRLLQLQVLPFLSRVSVALRSSEQIWKSHGLEFDSYFHYSFYFFNSYVSYLILLRLFQRRQWHPTPVLLPGKSHGRRSLVGCSPRGHEESDTTERLHFDFSLSCIGEEMATHSCVLAWRIPGTGEPAAISGGAAISGVAQSQTRLK